MVLKALDSFVQQIWFIYIRLRPVAGWLIGFDLLLLVSAFLAFHFDPNTVIFFVVVSVVSFGASMWIFAKNLIWFPDLEETQVLRREELSAIQPSSVEERDGFVTLANEHVKQGVVIYSRRFNAHLRAHDFPLSKDDDHRKALYLRMREHAELYEALLRHLGAKHRRDRKDFRNERKVGVCSPIHSGATEVRVHPVDYFVSHLTNEQSIKTFKLTETVDARNWYEPAQHYPVSRSSGETRLLDLGDYAYGNHLGVSTIGLCSDGILKFWKQNHYAALSPNLIAPLGSGSCDWGDMQGQDTLKALLIRSVNREFREESLKAHLAAGAPILETRVIGFFRNLARGGKPDFVGISLFSEKSIKLFPNSKEVGRDAVEFTHKVSCLGDLRRVVEFELTTVERLKKFSIPLWVNLVALKDYIEDDPDGVCDFFQIQRGDS